MGCINFCKGDNCSRCGQCCADFIPISKNEAKLISKYANEKNIEPTDWAEFNDKGELISLASLCPFLSKDHKSCLIYPVRPSICRTFKCNKDGEVLEQERKRAANKAYFNTEKNGVTYNVYSLVEMFGGPKSRTIQLLVLRLPKEHRTYDNARKLLIKLGRKDLANSKELKQSFGLEKTNGKERNETL